MLRCDESREAGATQTSSPYLPVVGVTACRKTEGLHPVHGVGEKYLTAVASAADVAPIILPALGGQTNVAQVLALCHGLLFTGSPSNVEAWRYGERPDDPLMKVDPQRDATTLPLLAAAITAGTPVLCICRGFQELNVVCGGTLHRRVHEAEGFCDHREDHTAALDRQYGPSHRVSLVSDGVLATLLGAAEIDVNSLHAQGIKTLGKGLRPEGFASDGLIEAISMPEAPGFVLGVQWHPEWRALDNETSSKLFAAFGKACRAYRARLENEHVPYSDVV